jgi:ribosomal protein S18 acetylase RimI-like enzyme
MAIAARSFTPSDLDDLARIIAAAYGAPLSSATRAQLIAAPDDIILADFDGALAGVVLLANYGEIAYVGSMAVDPALRRRGIGRALMHELLARCERTGVTALALDATESGAPLYREFGFVQTDVTQIFERAGVGPVAPEDGRAAPESVDAALAVERALVGWRRDDVLKALLAIGGSKLICEPDGFAFLRGTVVGPWVAGSEARAEEILVNCIAGRREPLRAFVPGVNVAAGKMLRRHGFHRTRLLRHMTRGEPAPRREFIYGQASLAHG